MNKSVLTPFSGLSLIVHLTVIGLGNVSEAIDSRFLSRHATAVRLPKKKRLLLRSILATSVFLVLSTIMFSLFGVAITTGVREGAREWHRQLIQRTAENLWASVDHSFEPHLTKK